MDDGTGQRVTGERRDRSAVLLALIAGAASALLVRQRRARDVRLSGLRRVRDRLAGDLLAAEEHARLTFGASVHDGPLQLLLVARHELELVEDHRARQAEALVLRACEELRGVLSAAETGPSRLDGRQHLDDWCRVLAGEGRFTWAVDVDPELRTVPPLALAAARELITNAAKHADPRRLEVRVRRVDAHVEVSVADDGRGRGDARDGFGLRTLRARLTAAGGALVLVDRPTGGTDARAWVPLEAEAAPAAPAARTLAGCR